MGTGSGTSCMLSRSSTNERQPQLPAPSLFKTPLSCWRSQDILLSNATFSFWILLTALWTIRHVPLLSIKNTCGIYKRDLISFSQNMEGIGDTVDTFPVCSRSDLSLQRVAKFTLLTINAHRLQSHSFIKSCKMVVSEFHHSSLLTGILRRYSSLHEVQGYPGIWLMPKCRKKPLILNFQRVSSCVLSLTVRPESWLT